MQLRLVTTPTGSVSLPGNMVGATVDLSGVDWTQEAVVVVDMGEQRTGGYSVKVTDVRQSVPGEVGLTLVVVRPGPRSVVAQVLTHPYAVARIRRQLLPVGPLTVVARDQSGREIARQVVPQ